MSLIPNACWINPDTSYFVTAPIRTSTIQVSSISGNNASFSSITSQYATFSSTFTCNVTLGNQQLTANSTNLLLNGIPVATTSNLSSSLADWSFYPQTSTLIGNNQDINGTNILTAKSINTSSLNTSTASIITLSGTNGTFINLFTQNLMAFNIVNFTSTVIDVYESTIRADIMLANISTANIKNAVVSSGIISTLYATNAVFGNLTASTITVSSIISPPVNDGVFSTLNVSGLTTTYGLTVSATATLNDGANFYGSRPNFTTGINTTGANNFNNTNIDNARNILGNTLLLASPNYININTSSYTAITNDRGADVGGFSQINLTSKFGQGTRVNITADAASYFTPAAATQAVNITANASVNYNGVAGGGAVNIVANGAVGETTSVLGNGVIRLTAFSALSSPPVPGLILQSAGSISAYSGLASPATGVYGCSFYSALVTLSLTCGATPVTTSFPGVVYLRGDNGTKVVNGLYVDSLNNNAGFDLNIASKTADISNRNINIDSALDLKLNSSNGGQVIINGSVYPPASGSGVWASTATTALNMNGFNITGISNLYSAGDFNIFAPSGLGIGLNNNTYFNNKAIGDVGAINMTSGAIINASGGSISNLGNIYGSNLTITTGGNLQLKSSTGGNVIIQTTTAGNISVNGVVFTTNATSWVPGTVHTLFGDVVSGAKYISWTYPTGTHINDNCNISLSCSNNISLTAPTITLTGDTIGTGGNVSVNGVVFTTNATSWVPGTVHTLFGDVVSGGKYISWTYPTGTQINDNCNISLSCSNNISLTAPTITFTGVVTSFSNIYAGAAVIGTPSAFGSNFAYFGHNALAANGTEYALIQSDGGETLLNCKTGSIMRFRQNNTDIFTATASYLDLCNHYINNIASLYFANGTDIYAGYSNQLNFDASNSYFLGNLRLFGSGRTLDIASNTITNVQQITFLGGNITTGSNYLDIRGLGSGNYASLINGGSYYTIDTAGNCIMYSSNVAGVRASNNVYIQSDTSYVELIANSGTGTVYLTAGFTEFRGNAGFTPSNSYINGLAHIYGNTAAPGGGLAIDYMYGLFFNSGSNNANLYASGGTLNMANYNGGTYIQNFNSTGTGDMVLYNQNNPIILATGATKDIAINSGRSINLNSAQPDGYVSIYTSTINTTSLLDTNITGNRAVTVAAGTGDINLRTSGGNFNASGGGAGHYATFNNGAAYLQYDSSLNASLYSPSNIRLTANADIILLAPNIQLNGTGGGSLVLDTNIDLNCATGRYLTIGNFGGSYFQIQSGGAQILTTPTGQDITVTAGGNVVLATANQTYFNNGGYVQFNVDHIYMYRGYLDMNNHPIYMGNATIYNTGELYNNNTDLLLSGIGRNIILNATSAGNSIVLNTSTINVNGKLDMHTNDISNLSYVSGSNIVIQDLGGNLDLLSYRVAIAQGFLDLPATDSKIDFNGYCYISRDSGTSNFNIKASKNLSILTSSVTRNLGATEVVQPVIQYGTATGSGASGSVTVALPTPFTSATSYIATASMMDITAAKMSVNRNNRSTITIYWDQAGAGSQSIGWTCMGN
jgi:hypothetical protein